jgi:hypothetical protein
VLTEEFSHLPATEMIKVVHHKYKDKNYVLAHVHASGDIQPSRVKLMEKALENELKAPVELFVRSTLSRDISSTGSTNQVLTETLDGFFVGRTPDPRIKLIKQSEQTIREYLETQLGMYVEEINLISLDGRPVILATIFGAKKMSSEEIEKLEFKIRNRTGDSALNLVVRHINLNLYDRLGKVYYEWTTLQNFTPEQEMVFKKIKDFLKTEFDKSEYFLGHSDVSIREGIYHVLVELTGRKLYSHTELVELRKKLLEIIGKQVQVYVRSKPEVVLTQSGDSSFDKLQEKFLKQSESLYQKKINKMIEESL